MQENLELSLLKNIPIIIFVVRWEVVETHIIIYTVRSGQVRSGPAYTELRLLSCLAVAWRWWSEAGSLSSWCS